MGVDARHPDYDDRADEWKKLRDVARGPQAVKNENEVYLPKPSGFTAQADQGAKAYSAYRERAQFADVFSYTHRGMVGLIHKKEAQITLPDSMMPLWEGITKDGLTIEALHRYITSELLTVGRVALLVDAPKEGAPVLGLGLPWIACYTAEALINWSDERDFFVLNETGMRRDPEDEFKWVEVKQYRVLRMDPVTGVFTMQQYDDQNPGELITPTAAGAKTVPEIPFVVIGTTDLSTKPAEPPLLGVCEAALAMYRLDADYRYQLYMSGQETFCISGIDSDSLPTVIGAGVVLALPIDAKAEYVGPKGTGIEAHRLAIGDERTNAAAQATKVMDGAKGGAESGDALRIRMAAQQATLTTIALASAAGLEKALRFLAARMGANAEEVIVKPNLEFVDSILTPDQVLNLVKSWQGGAFSFTTLYENLQRGGVASEERTVEEEQALIETEAPMLPQSDETDTGVDE